MTGDNVYSNIFKKDSNENCNIITYIDFDKVIDEKWFLKYITDIVNSNSFLKQTVDFKTVNNFDINKHFTIKYASYNKFDKCINSLLNDCFEMEIKWFFVLYIDKELNKSRMYFKIHHAYLDAYSLIKMLTNGLVKNNTIDIKKQFIRNNKNIFEKIYYYFIGTIIILLTTIKNLIQILISTKVKINEKNDKKNYKSDYITCKKLNFTKIKEFTKKHNITINDFLYLIVVKADKLYYKKNKDLKIQNAIYVSNSNKLNNTCCFFNIINNSQDNNILIKKIHETFNYVKFSLFIPILNYVINNIIPNININNDNNNNTDILSFLSNIINNDFDYGFGNVIGPSFNDFKDDLKPTDFNYLLKTTGNHVCYCIVSSGDNINITCTFKEGRIKNKKKFKKCIYKVYSDLVLNDGINNNINVNDMV
jgi:hypothetical protein